MFADKLLQKRFPSGHQAGISICIDDMLVPAEKHGIIDVRRRKRRRSNSSTFLVW